MRKIPLRITGFCFFLLVAGGVFFGFYSIEQRRQRESAEQFVLSAISNIALSWEIQELEKYRHLSLYEKTSKRNFESMFNIMRGVGNLQSLEIINTEFQSGSILALKAPVSANYKFNSKFEQGSVRTEISIILGQENWQITDLVFLVLSGNNVF